MMFNYTFLLVFIFISFSQSYTVAQREAMMNRILTQYYISHDIDVDSTFYSPEVKSNLIESAYLDGHYQNISRLAFYDEDTLLNPIIIKKWIASLYNEQHYFLIDFYFSSKGIQNIHVAMSYYKLKRYKSFLLALENIKKHNLTTHIAKLDALFRLKRYDDIISDRAYFNRKSIPLQIKQIHIRAHYKLQNYSAITDIFKSFSTDQLTPEIVFIGAQAYMRQKEYDISDYYFKLYVNNFKKNEMKEFQLAHYYLGLTQQEQHNIVAAQQLYDQAISYNPFYTDLSAFIHQTLGSYYEENKAYQKALDEWIKYLALLPETHTNRQNTADRIEALREKAFFYKDKKSTLKNN